MSLGGGGIEVVPLEVLRRRETLGGAGVGAGVLVQLEVTKLLLRQPLLGWPAVGRVRTRTARLVLPPLVAKERERLVRDGLAIEARGGGADGHGIGVDHALLGGHEARAVLVLARQAELLALIVHVAVLLAAQEAVALQDVSWRKRPAALARRSGCVGLDHEVERRLEHSKVRAGRLLEPLRDDLDQLRERPRRLVLDLALVPLV